MRISSRSDTAEASRREGVAVVIPSFALQVLLKRDLPRWMMKPNYELEQALLAGGRVRIAGVDEVGRGPLAGPVVAAAVILNPVDIPEGLNDSKKLTAKRRAALDAELHNRAQISIAEASVTEIDELNILQASHLAMVRAVKALTPTPDFLLIDGNMIPRDIRVPSQAVVKGDAQSLSIAAASIVAKNWRDKLMVDLAQQHPGYGWEANAGYPTKQHREALRNLGATPHHRVSFKPVHNILYQE
ncbi:ribonuclease HII [Ruegeria arenilitoris]|uniref:ribonuclease HII n=1 Tax=Ruegeria arenilitoris TaxID=1173585 RepID=UPI001580CF91|nr:ribonuclease HII [Ruegeria arenilitoris]